LKPLLTNEKKLADECIRQLSEVKKYADDLNPKF